MLRFLDIIFYLIHILVISFNLLGWVWHKTLRLHLIVMLLTLGSWLVLGIWYGLGYCFITDWHWQVKQQLGENNLPYSFIQYLFESLGWNIQPNNTDVITIFGTALALAISIYKNIKFYWKKG